MPRIPLAPVQAQPLDARKADYAIEIANGLADIGANQVISTTLYNGQFPGDHCCGFMKDKPRPWTFITERIIPNSCIGMGKKSPPMSMAPGRKDPSWCRLMA
jgi:hypothetical protein